MKTFLQILYTIVCIILGFALGVDINSTPKVDLPEEYKAITDQDNLKGYYYKDVLHLYFANPDNSVLGETEYMLELTTTDSVIIQSVGDGNKLYTVPFNKLEETIELDNL